MTIKIARNDLILSIRHNSFHRADRSSMDSLLDLVITRRLLQPDSKINDGDVRSWDTESLAALISASLPPFMISSHLPFP